MSRPSQVSRSCSTDHISDWPTYSGRFGLTAPFDRHAPVQEVPPRLYEVTLSFTPYRLDPKRTLTLRVTSVGCEEL